jgi:hypothetical protein
MEGSSVAIIVSVDTGVLVAVDSDTSHAAIRLTSISIVRTVEIFLNIL